MQEKNKQEETRQEERKLTLKELHEAVYKGRKNGDNSFIGVSNFDDDDADCMLD